MTVRITRLCLFCIGISLALLIIPLIPLGRLTARAASLRQADDFQASSAIESTLPARPYAIFIPFVERHSWIEMPLINSGFEMAWATESSHQAIMVNTDSGAITQAAYDNILTPPGWLTWFSQGVAVPDEGIRWGQPEVRSVRHTNPDRMNSGTWGQLLFTFWRVHDAGFLQHVEVITGQQVRLTGWAHAWSNNGGAPTLDKPEDPYWSEGSHVGYNQFYAREGTEGLDGGDQNFTFMLGIDPTGGSNPMADTVIWGPGMHIYNAYQEVPAVAATAQGSSITIFLRSRTLWRYKHNDAYWDDVKLEVVR